MGEREFSWLLTAVPPLAEHGPVGTKISIAGEIRKAMSLKNSAENFPKSDVDGKLDNYYL